MIKFCVGFALGWMFGWRAIEALALLLVIALLGFAALALVLKVATSGR